MPHFSFHFAAGDHVVLDEIGKHLADLYEAHAYALKMIRGIQSVLPGEDDWVGWTVRITDESGRGVLTVMFPDPRRSASSQVPRGQPRIEDDSRSPGVAVNCSMDHARLVAELGVPFGGDQEG